MDIRAEEPIRVVGIILEEVGEPRRGTPGGALYRVPFRLSRAPSASWVRAFLKAWDLPPRFTSMHRPGIAQVVEDRVILDGTTIDEVKRYHFDTLKLAVSEANRLEERGSKRSEASEARAREELRHREHVAAVAKELKFE